MNLINPNSLLLALPSLPSSWIIMTGFPSLYSFRKCLLCDYEIHQCRKFSTSVDVVVVEKHHPSPTHLTRSDLFPGTNASSTSHIPSPIPSAAPLSSLTHSSHLSKCLSIKEASYLLDGFHAKEEKFRKILESKEGPVSVGTKVWLARRVIGLNLILLFQ